MLPTPRICQDCKTDVWVRCISCLHTVYLDWTALIAAGHGDRPLVQMRFRCSRCRSWNVDWRVCGTRYGSGPDSRAP